MKEKMQGQQKRKMGKKRGSCWNRQRHSHGSNIIMCSIGKRKHFSQNEMYCRKLCSVITAQEEALENAYDELEVERNASATAMDEAMLVIWRLQNENARLAMEASHLKREAEHKMAYAQEALEFYEGTLMVKDEEIRALESEITIYRKRYGFCNHETNGSMDKTPRDPLEEDSYEESETGFLNQDDVGFQDEESCVECDKFVVTHERAASIYGESDDSDVLPWGWAQSLKKPSGTGNFLCGVDGCSVVCTPRELYSRLDVPPDQDLASELIKQGIYSCARKQKDAGSEDIVGQESKIEEDCYRKAMVVKKLQYPKGKGLPSFVKSTVESMVVGALLGYVGKILTYRSR